MPYCTLSEFDKLLAQSITSATSPTLTGKRSLITIGRTRDSNQLPTDTVNQYIQWAGQEIDSTLSELYKTPFCELADFQSNLYSDVTEYNSYIVLERSCPLSAGDTIILIYQDIQERHVLDDAVSDTVFATVDPIQYAFPSGSRLVRVKFPDPIPWVAVRLAVSNVYDKFLSAQSSPDISNYGKFLRDQARQKLNDVLNGRAILHGVQRTGRRLYDPNIPDQYGLPKGNDGSKDIDKLG